MTIEQKKEWLYRYQNSQRRQKIILLQIEDARSRATSVQSTPGGVRVAPTGLRPDRVADAVQRLDELQRAYDAEVAQGCQIYAEIQTAIEALPDIVADAKELDAMRRATKERNEIGQFGEECHSLSKRLV